MAPADIDRGLHQRIVHGHSRLTVATAGVRLRSNEREAECDSHVFHQVVFEIASRFDGQIDACIAAQRLEHVGQKVVVGVYAGRRVVPGLLARRARVEAECQLDLGLTCGALDGRHCQ
jgi:hypothetical protein